MQWFDPVGVSREQSSSFEVVILSQINLIFIVPNYLFTWDGTVEPDFSKLFERQKNVYYCQEFTIYHVINAMISNYGKQQKVY